MKLFHAPGTCSIGIQILLEEIGLDYELVQLDFRAGEQNKPEFRAFNPKGKVPALMRNDGIVLTEFPAIAYWLAKAFPDAKLLPEGLEAEIRVLEMLEYVVSGVHMRGATLAMLPMKFAQGQDAQSQVSSHGREVMATGLTHLAEQLGNDDYFFGEFSILDAAVFYLVQWKERAKVELPETLQRFDARMKARPSVRRAMQ